MAAGIFGHLKDIVLSHVQQEPTPDLSPDTLNALSALMVAQAQEAIYRKAAAGIGIRQCHKCLIWLSVSFNSGSILFFAFLQFSSQKFFFVKMLLH